MRETTSGDTLLFRFDVFLLFFLKIDEIGQERKAKKKVQKYYKGGR